MPTRAKRDIRNFIEFREIGNINIRAGHAIVTLHVIRTKLWSRSRLESGSHGQNG